MDSVTLRSEVEAAVDVKLANQEAFTIVDISHPIIEKDKTVRHKDVKSFVEGLHRDGLMSSSGYKTSMIDVHPKPGVTKQARLWHPDTFDVSTYQSVDQTLTRNLITQDDKLPDSLL